MRTMAAAGAGMALASHSLAQTPAEFRIGSFAWDLIIFRFGR
jgi:hypothetical protein